MFSLGGPLSSTFLLDHQWLSLHSIENLFDNQDLEGVEYYIQKSTALVGEIELPVYRCLRGTNNLGKVVALSLGLGLALIFFFFRKCPPRGIYCAKYYGQGGGGKMVPGKKNEK